MDPIAPTRDSPAAPRRTSTEPPEVRGAAARQPWTLTLHAVHRAKQMHLTRAEIVATVERPECDYPCCNGRDSNRRRTAVCGHLAVIYNPEARLIITVLWAGKESRWPAAA